MERGVKDQISGREGYKDHFTKATYKATMEATGLVELAANLFSMDLKFSATPGVPINVTATNNLRDREFADPVPYPDKIRIAVPDKKWPAWEHIGQWKAFSLEEMVHAYLLAFARDVTAQKGDKVLKAWRSNLLTVTFSFEVVSGVETLFWKANNLREDLRGRFDACVRTTVQRIVRLRT